MTNEMLVSSYLSGDSKALEILIENNKKLIWNTIKAMNLYETKLYSNEDYFSIGVNGLIRAVNTYDNNKGKFSTYAVTCIRTDLQQMLRHEQTKGRADGMTTVSYYETTSDGTVLLDTFVDNNASTPFSIGEALLEVIKTLDEKETTFFDLRFVQGISRSDITAILNISVGEFKSLDRKVRIKIAKGLGVDYDPKMAHGSRRYTDEMMKG